MTDPSIEAVVPAISNRIRQTMAQMGIPGLAIGIVRDQTMPWSSGFGHADLASARAMDENTCVGVASISKTFTATAIMQLRDLGKLRLDDPVVHHIAEFGAVKNRFGRNQDVSIRGLLNHHSGLVGESPTGHWSTMTFPTMSDIVALLPRVEVVIEPASAFKYCNLAFALLGEIVERTSGRAYADHVRDEILLPLGMTASGFAVDDQMRARSATGYLSNRYEDVPEVAPDPPIHGYAAAAGLRSSVADLAKWLSLQFRTRQSPRSGQQVLAGRSLSEMHRVSHVEPDWSAGYALAWMALRLQNNIHLHHSGSVPGFLSTIAFHKPSRLGVVVLTNKQGHNAAAAIAFGALEALLAEDTRRGRPAPARAPVPTPAKLRPLLGRYASSPVFGILLQIEFRNGALVLVTPPDPYMPPPPPPAPLAATDEAAVFLVGGGRPAGETLTFHLAADGSVTGLTLVENGSDFRKVD
jgi:D-alanyl-D-alanine carboxypeptidase